MTGSAAQRIDDLGDPRLDPFRGIRDRELRGRDGVFMAESLRVVRRLLRSGRPVRTVMVTDRASAELERELGAALDRDDPPEVLVIPDGLQESIAGSRFHGGALAIGVRPRRDPPLDEILDAIEIVEPEIHRRRLVLAEGVTHPDNVGTIFRSAACLGVHAILLDGRCADPLLRKAIRYSMGRVFSLPWTTVDRSASAIEALRRRGYAICAAETDARAVPAWAVPRDRPIAIAVGGEAAGLAEETLAAADHIVHIPFADRPVGGDPDDVPSLNVAVAAALVVEETRPDRPGTDPLSR
ncbi:MAG: TrmH family RNA methyltransferase [Planctomycetota bacterium]